MPLALLVEGNDDKHVIKHLLLARGIQLDKSDDIVSCDGINCLLDDDLDVTLNKLGYTSVGVVADADSNVLSRWAQIRDRLRNASYDAPDAPAANGTIINGEKTVGVWLMPDNVSNGTLEHFVARLQPTDESLWHMAREAVAGIPESPRRFAASAFLKAELHTYLAWREEPGTPLGLAITKRYFDTSATTADAFVAWFQRLRHA